MRELKNEREIRTIQVDSEYGLPLAPGNHYFRTEPAAADRCKCQTEYCLENASKSLLNLEPYNHSKGISPFYFPLFENHRLDSCQVLKHPPLASSSQSPPDIKGQKELVLISVYRAFMNVIDKASKPQPTGRNPRKEKGKEKSI